jgi:hypothetical protein
MEMEAWESQLRAELAPRTEDTLRRYRNLIAENRLQGDAILQWDWGGGNQCGCAQGLLEYADLGGDVEGGDCDHSEVMFQATEHLKRYPIYEPVSLVLTPLEYFVLHAEANNPNDSLSMKIRDELLRVIDDVIAEKVIVPVHDQSWMD